ncbi:RNA-binding S4 domain-containing protein [Nocardioides sp. CER19]|uniref:RNA-binding S4 domain-containing protein n=1 Tax=Nocardioides sp. CER19 TaxID=3038538 RepID=UPI002449D264|nr:RNA-binding S4 domain-containing protein [Nocardioides sp. CER19]MDH2413583.1 RNA-binding S4 domain-containing protein [Nocardioides sp. CER19]
MTARIDVRIDVWCWAVRLYKSRSQATAGAKAGHIRINGVRAKPAQPVKVGDEVRVFTDREHVVVVKELLAKRVGAPLAQAAYDDRTPALPPKEERAAPVFSRERGAGRPTKRDRRLLDQLRQMGR